MQALHRRYSPVKTAILIAIIAALASTARGDDLATVELKTRSGSYSGVIISPSGLIVTAEHASKSATISVRMSSGQERTAVLRYQPPINGVDEAQIYQIVGGGEFPFSPLASDLPTVGDKVSATGYAKGELRSQNGKVTDSGFSSRPDGNYSLDLRDGLVTDWASTDGMSGGPLFNDKGEVIGVLSMSGNWPKSYWISLPSILEAVRKSQFPTNKRRLVMFSEPGNRDCELYEKEIEATSNGIQVIRTDSEEFPQWKHAYESSTRRALGNYPTFWVEGTNRTRSAKYEPGLLGSILGWFRGIIQAILGGLFGSPPVEAPERFQRDQAPTPLVIDKTPEQELLDPSNITVVILAKKQDIGLAKGTAAKIALDKAAGPLQRKLDEALGGRARLVLIPERTLPDRFLAVADAAKTDADPATVIVLVRSQSLGLKSLIAGKVERTIAGKIPESVPVDIVFERIRPDDFHAILEATYAGEVPDAEVIVKEGEPIEPPVSNGILMGLLSSVTAGWGAKEAMAWARKRGVEKAMKIVGEKLHGDEA